MWCWCRDNHTKQNVPGGLIADHWGRFALLPLAAKKLGADPAIMATPFITTIVDACSLILYFQIAQLVFKNMM